MNLATTVGVSVAAAITSRGTSPAAARRGARTGRGHPYSAPVVAPSPSPGDHRRPWRTAAVLVGFVALLVVARVWGDAIIESGRVIRLGAPPLVGWDRWRPSWRVAVPVVVGLVAVAATPSALARLTWRRLLLVSAVATMAWALALAFVDGTAGVTDPTVVRGDEYLLNVPDVDDLGPAQFLVTFTDRIDDYVTHVRSHPPGMVLALWGLDAVGLGGQWAAALFMVLGGASAVPAVLITVRQLAGEAVARRAAPFLVLAPAAIWIAVTADALFAGVAAWSVAALTVAANRNDRRGDLLAAVAGLGFGVGLMLSYGIVLVGFVALAVLWHHRRIRPGVVAVAGALTVLGAFAAAGFSWIDGALTTRGEYNESVASTRPYGFFLVSNAAAAAVAVGPAVAVAVARLRDRRVWLVVGAALAAMAVSNLSGLTKGEVERIWLPFTVWVLAAGTALWRPGDHRALRGWLGLQVTFALAVQVAVFTRW